MFLCLKTLGEEAIMYYALKKVLMSKKQHLRALLSYKQAKRPHRGDAAA